METYYPLLYLIVSFAIAVASVILAITLRNSRADLEARLTGLWVNESQTIRILIHHIDSVFQGEVVWINSVKSVQQQILGTKMIKDMALKSNIQGSTGIYIDPDSGIELPFKMWFKGKGTIKLAVIHKINGKDKVLKEERWFQL